MAQKYIIPSSLLIILMVLILAGCTVTATTRPTSSQLPISIPITTTPAKLRTEIIKTSTPSIIASPTYKTSVTTETATSKSALAQLTYVFHHANGKSDVHAQNVYCYQTEPGCLGTPELLFEWNDWISGIDWSPDGKKVIFMSGMYGTELYISDWNGKNAIQVTGKCGTAEWPKWSLDGSKVAYIFAEGKNDCEYLDYPRIQIFDIASGQVNEVFTTANGPSRINWLPGGEFAYIAYNSETARIETIYIVEKNGNIIHQLPPNADNFTHILGLSFSNDGQQIAFVGDTWPITGTETTDIYIADREGNNTLNITEGKGLNFAPAWSPLGDWIAFESNRTGDYEIYVIKPDGKGLMQITNNNASYPAWRVLP